MNVFVSYRRSDTQDLAGHIVDRLRAVREIHHVFIDVDGIEPGADFEAKIQSALAACDVCILLIGPQWRGADGQRLFEPRDFVRLEAAAALSGARKVLPVLANGAQMPQADELPDDLQRLPSVNALSIRHLYFDHDFEYLIDTVLSRKKPGQVAAYFRRHPVQAGVVRALAGVVVALTLLLVAAAVHGMLTSRSLEESVGGEGHVWLLIAAVLVMGAVLALLVRPIRRSPRSANRAT